MYFFTLVVGYFANAQYDVFFIPYRHFVPLPPKEEAKTPVILNEVKNPTEELTGIYTFSLWSWDISLTLNMTYFFLLVIASVARQSPGRVKTYGV